MKRVGSQHGSYHPLPRFICVHFLYILWVCCVQSTGNGGRLSHAVLTVIEKQTVETQKIFLSMVTPWISSPKVLVKEQAFKDDSYSYLDSTSFKHSLHLPQIRGSKIMYIHIYIAYLYLYYFCLYLYYICYELFQLGIRNPSRG